ncbi:DUF4365 domain-containing protein [Archangium lipolyticum]|uniref:DUF4365 domain-containing protein n=1 Tax=Archangium lipolyticum TaxID=2970465 RepID=UPI00214A1414|nr:DUF4365 domain-containing protein [Archangium lipolyticum]
MARTRQHVIETESRRIVASLLPAERFVERDQTERDYGIDLSVECFDAGEPSGAYLFFQLKGTDDPSPPADAKSIAFDMKVNSLKRVERFATPVLLVWCPVQAVPQRFWFLWLQSYIRVVLNYENPGWRNQETVRLHIPVENVIPDANGHNLRRLRHIAGHPTRVEQFGQLARLTHEAPFIWEDPAKLGPFFEECLRLDAIFGDTEWRWAKDQRGVVEKGLRACQIALRGIDPTDDELREIGWVLSDKKIVVPGGPPKAEDLTWQDRWKFLAYAAQHCAQLLLNMVAVYFDDRLRHTLWKTEGDHDF